MGQTRKKEGGRERERTVEKQEAEEGLSEGNAAR